MIEDRLKILNTVSFIFKIFILIIIFNEIFALERVIEDDDDSEYDSEMDDFIDDGDAGMDYSSHIKHIFGYDKSK